jgi:hypothetical protein
LILALAATRLATASMPDLWQSEAQLTARYGDPTEIQRWDRSDPAQRVFTYRVKDLQLQVRFLKGLSHSAIYEHRDGRSFAPSEVTALLEANSAGQAWQKQSSTLLDPEQWELGTPPVASALISSSNSYVRNESGEPTEVTFHSLSIETTEFARHRESSSLWNWFRSALTGWFPAAWTGREKTFTGIAEFKEEGETSVLIFRDSGSVIAVPWSSKFLRPRAPVIAGRKYHLTLREDESTDLDVPIAFVSDRLHDSHGARVADSDFYRLRRITDESKTVFDESVCEVHHTRMKLVEANVEYGMIGTETSEVEFPHHRDWIRGGCVVGDVKRAEHYVCSQCVAASEKYKREHPDEARVSD